jgi:hypothetical protein
VPEEAIVSFAGVTKVFVVDEGRAREYPIKPGVSMAVAGPEGPRTWIEVAGTIPADARVITSGLSQLADGTEVRVRKN